MSKKSYTINKVFSEQFNTMGSAKVTNPVVTNPKAPTNVGKKKPPIVQHSKFTDENMSESDYSALAKKAELTEIPIEILGEVFDRGVDCWTDNTNLTPQQFAFNRVNSFISKGKAYREDDADLAEQLSEDNVPFGRRKDFSSFSNWKFDIKPGQRTKVLTGDHKGKRGVVLGKTDHADGPVYRIKHDDGTVLKHHISTLEDPGDSKPERRRVSEEVELQEAKDPVWKRDSIGAKQLKSKGYFAHSDYNERTNKHNWMLHAPPEPGKSVGKEIAGGSEDLHSQVHDRVMAAIRDHRKNLQEARPENNPQYDHSEKMWNERQAMWEKREKSKKAVEESKNTPHVRPHYGDSSNPKRQTAWKASNKHGKVKYFGLDFEDSAYKHAGVLKESSMDFDQLMKEMEKHQAAIDRFGGKYITTNSKHPGGLIGGYVTGHDPKKDGHVLLTVNSTTGSRRGGSNDEHNVHSVNIKHLNENAPEDREVGTDSLAATYANDTPGQKVSEEVVSADRRAQIVRPFKKEITDPKTGERKQQTIKGHTKTAPVRKVIINSGNLTNGKPSV